MRYLDHVWPRSLIGLLSCAHTSSPSAVPMVAAPSDQAEPDEDAALVGTGRLLHALPVCG